MNIRLLDQAVALGLAGLGGTLIWSGFGYGFMQGTTPGAGFFPVLMGIVLLVLSLINFGRSVIGVERLKADMTRPQVLKFVAIVVAMLVFVLLTPWIGMTIAAMLLMLAIAFIIRPSLERGYLIRLVLTALITPIVCKLVFGQLLHVPIPAGPLGL